jgi:hypothetical protein
LRASCWAVITAWYGNCINLKRRALQALQDTYSTRCHRKAKKIKDINHPSHGLFTPLSSRKRGQYKYIKAGTERLKNKQLLSQGHQTVK